MRIRKGKSGDEKNIAEVIISAWKHAYKGILDQHFLDALTTERHEELFREQLKAGSYVIHVLENDAARIVGMVSGGADSSGQYDCEIVAIYIENEYQKTGYGKLLFLKNVEQYIQKGYQSMIVWTLEKNKDRAFYERMGGDLRESKKIIIGDEEVTLIGFVWEDIRLINR